MTGLSTWWKDDIRSVLAGIAYAIPHMGTERTPEETASFQEGFACALSAVAISLGIEMTHGECQVTMLSGPYQVTGASNGIPRLTATRR